VAPALGVHEADAARLLRSNAWHDWGKCAAGVLVAVA
jgi:hypothetical protein